MNISPPHRPIPLHRPWWSRQRLPLLVVALLLGGSAAVALAGRDMRSMASASVSAEVGAETGHAVPGCTTVAQARPEARAARGE